VLPQLDRMLRGFVFNPSTADDTFRICVPDSSAIALASTLPRRLRGIAPNTQLEIVAWHHNAFDDITHGRIDVLVWANHVPSPLLSREIYDDDVVCVISTEHSIGDRPLTQKDYLEYPHVLVTLLNPWGRMVDEALGQQPHHIRIGMRVPYYGAAVLGVRDTDLIATLPRHAALRYAQADQVRILRFPFKIAPIRYLYAWHPSTDNEPSLVWFRKQLVDVANQVRQELDQRFEMWRAQSC
jgi:DNA-binding transcriptional LysR family regulator